MATTPIRIGSTAAKKRPRRYRQSPTLIPVTLRVLDDTGRHRITEPMVGIMTHVSSDELRISVTGPAGRPLSRGLGRRRKIHLGFINNELHEMVEALVCELIETKDPPPQTDARVVRLAVPQLPHDLFEEVFEALKRYAPARRTSFGWFGPAAVSLLASAIALVAWTAPITSERNDLQRRTERLSDQLKYSTKTIDRLSVALEDADAEVVALRKELDGTKRLRSKKDRKAEKTRKSSDTKASEAPPQQPKVATEPSIRNGSQLSDKVQAVKLRGASWDDFQRIRTIRGSNPSPRISYASGDIELILGGRGRERATRMLTRLLSAYALSRDIDLRAFGAWSLESADKSVGIEPDESFIIGPVDKPLPDLVFDHAQTQAIGTLLVRYQELGVKEVWLRTEDDLEVFQLNSNGYEKLSKSQWLPNLSLAHLSQFLDREDQTAATQEFMGLFVAQ